MNKLSRAISKPELWVLILFFGTLPLFRGVKNTLIVVFCLMWFVQSYREKNYGGLFRSWEWVLVAFTLSGFVSCFTNPFGWEGPMSGVFTFIKLMLPVVLLSRLTINLEEVKVLVLSVVIGAFVAIIESWLSWDVTKNIYPELKSVGHVNQSALYISLAFGAVVSLAIISKGWQRLLFIGGAIFFALAMLPTRSMTASAVVVSMFMMAVIITFRVNRQFLGSLTLILLVAGTGWKVAENNSNVAQNFEKQIEYRLDGGDTGSNFWSYRDMIFKNSVFILKDYPLFGAGDRHFGLATGYDNVKAVTERRGVEYRSDEFHHTVHGHNFVTSIMVNRGYIGLSLMLFFLLLIGWQHLLWLINYFKTRNESIYPLLGIMSGIYVAVGGIGQSTLYVEHGQLAFCFIGISMSYLKLYEKHSFSSNNTLTS